MLLRGGMIAFTQQIQLYVLTLLLHKKPFKRFIFVDLHCKGGTEACLMRHLGVFIQTV